MLLLVSSVTFTNFAFGYEKENHYWLKMAIALNCGFTVDEARIIATGDWNMDEDSETAPVRTGSDKDNPKWKWHALPTENPDVDKNQVSSGNQQIKQRQHELYDRALNEKDTGMRLFKFGQYLHYQEDKWSHWGYTTGIGHAIPNIAPGMDSPDETHANPTSYRYMVFDSMVNLGKLAKSLGKNTECMSDLVPLDTYHSAPEYGPDFPWFSPQEIKRATDPKKFQNDVNKHLKDWKKMALIDGAIAASEDKGDEGVTDSFVTYIAKKTGISKSNIIKKYDYVYVDLDDNGNAKALPDSLTKSLKDNVKTSKTKSSDSAQLKNELKELYQISKTSEKITSIIKKANDDEAKTLKKLAGDAKSIYSKSKNSDAKKLGDKIQEQITDADSDKKQIMAIDADAKKITKQILAVAKKNKITKTELDKPAKDSKQESANQKDKTKPDSQLDHRSLSSGMLGAKTDELAKILFDTPTEREKRDHDAEKAMSEKIMNEILEATEQLKNRNSDQKNPQPQDADAPPESLLDDLDPTIRGPDVNEPKEKPQPKNEKPKTEEKDPNAPPESILDDVETDSGPDARAPKEKPKTTPSGIDHGRIALDDMIIIEQSLAKELQDQLRDKMLQIDLERQLKDLKQKIIIDDTKKPIIQKDPTKLPKTDTKPKPEVKPKSTPPEKTEKPVIQKDPVITKPSNTKPTLSIPKQITQEATGPAGANVAFSTSSQDKEDGSLIPTCNPSSGATFPIGATPVSCTVTDSNGNSVSGTFTVTVRDTTPPAFGPFQPTEGVKDDTGVQVFFDVTANDLVDGNVPVSCNYQSGYKFPPGVTELKCTTSDSRGNQSTKTVQITVTVTESGQ